MTWFWEARSLSWRAEVFLGLGLPGRAAADFARSGELFATTGQEFEYAMARHNLGLVALAVATFPGHSPTSTRQGAATTRLA